MAACIPVQQLLTEVLGLSFVLVLALPQPPSSLNAGAMLKEVIEDLEWPSSGAGAAAQQRGTVEVAMWAPRHERLAVSAMGEGGALTVRGRHNPNHS